MLPANQRPANWSQMNHEQKRIWRTQCWEKSSQNIQFINTEAKQRYETKVKRLVDVIQLKEPDQVPVEVTAGMLPLYESGLNHYAAIHDPERALQACISFNEKHAADLDSFSAVLPNPVRAFELLDYKLYAYPGHGMANNGVGFQFIEGEYMFADEYDDLIRDPTDFWLRRYIPRIFGTFSPLSQINPLTDIVGQLNVPLMSLASPDIQSMLQKMISAGQDVERMMKLSGQVMILAEQNGYVSFPLGCFFTAPFDTIGDTLRGTTGIMKDMYRYPAKLLKALDVVADITIKSLLSSPQAFSGLVTMCPLHKGADNWMSQKQFDNFYWPSLKKVMDALINEGMVISLFAEGGYNTRLNYVNQFPKGTVHWHFDQTDMEKAKKLLGNSCSIEGNVPSSLLVTGSPSEVKEYCRKLIEVCAPGGGFMLGFGALAEFPKLENLKAMVASAREFGVYPLRY
jgi:uroporphyrinogen-III decarboxylase